MRFTAIRTLHGKHLVYQRKEYGFLILCIFYHVSHKFCLLMYHVVDPSVEVWRFLVEPVATPGRTEVRRGLGGRSKDPLVFSVSSWF